MGVGRTLTYSRRRDFSRVDVLEQDQVCWGRRGGTLGMVAQACWPSDSCGPPGGYEQKHLPVGLHTQVCHLEAPETFWSPAGCLVGTRLESSGSLCPSPPRHLQHAPLCSFPVLSGDPLLCKPADPVSEPLAYSFALPVHHAPASGPWAVQSRSSLRTWLAQLGQAFVLVPSRVARG